MIPKKKPPIIGLAGGIGSGKSTIANLFNKLGIQSIDADDVAREAVAVGSYCLTEITKYFGNIILLKDGSLDRRKLRGIIFESPADKQWLESLTHPEIRKMIDAQLAIATSHYVLLVHPLLFETQQSQQCVKTIAIDAPPEIQIQRVMVRDSAPQEQVRRILDAQLSNEERLLKADFKIKNIGNTIDLNDKVLELHNRILELLSYKECRK